MSNPSDYTVGWICAISTERVAARAFLDEEHDMPDFVSPHDNNVYTLGRVWKHNVVIAALPDGEYGINAAASVARDMLHSFPNVRIGLMVGIGGGVPTRHDIRLGDVVVSAPQNGQGGIFQYDFGKTIQAQEFQNSGFLDQPPTLLRSAVGDLKARYESDGHQFQEAINSILDKTPRLQKKYQRPHTSTDRLYLSNAIHPLESDEGCAITCGDLMLVPREQRAKIEDDPKVHYGLIASGNQLMKDALIRDQLASKKDVLCFEMEAAGLVNHFPCLVIRGICDYSDSHKNRDWQGYAAMTAAAYAKDVLRRIPPSKIEAEKRLAVTLGIKESINQLIHMQHNQSNIAIFDWLTTVDYGTQQSDYLRRRQQGTGEWLLRSDQFQTWVKDENHMLFCPGMPGAGKTLLMSIVVDYLHSRFEKDPETGIAYFYFNYKRQDEQAVNDLLASLLRQLAEPQHSLPRVVKELHDKHKSKRTRPSVDELTKALQSVVMIYSRVFIMIDALDECKLSNGTRSSVLSGIFTLRSQTRANFLMTSRFNAEINETFHSIPTLEIRASDEDVQRYLRGNMVHFPNFVRNDFRLQEAIIASILQAVQGMFLLAQFHLDSLKGKARHKEIIVALQNLATGSDAYQQIYTETMQRIVSQYKEQAQLARSVLSWVTFAKRPMTVFELQYALGVEPGESVFDKDNMPDIELMVSVCAGLVTIDNDSTIIRLVHYTTQEYLQREHEKWLLETQSDMTATCLTYLSYKAFEYGTEDGSTILESYPFYDYAARHWGYHAREESVLRHEVMDFLEDTANIKSYRHNISTFVGEGHLYADAELEDQTTGLHLAAWFGLTSAVDQLLNNKAHIEATNLCNETPLYIAAKRGHEAIVQLLLDRGANIEGADGLSMAPLYIAALYGHEAVVHLLLNNGASIEASTTHDYTALHVAVRSVSMTQLLLDNGANIEAKTFRGFTPLHAAVTSSSSEKEAVIQLLLDNGANIDATDNHGQTPLFSTEGDTADLLLDKGANIEATDNFGRTPLFAAVEDGYQEEIGRLLNRGANIKATDKKGRTPLSAAVEMDLENIAKLLLDNYALMISDKKSEHLANRTRKRAADVGVADGGRHCSRAKR